jgi:cytochrome P450 family 9
MTNMNGDEWKEVRSTFSPIFTSGKLKGMYQLIKSVAESLSEEICTQAKQGTDFELKEVFGKFRKVFLCFTSL